MSFQIVSNADLQPHHAAGDNCWMSIGDDPFFDIRFATLRSPYILIFLKCDEECIDPRVYVNQGGGYREKDAVAFEPGNRFILVANVGRSGLVRSFRLDPASFPCCFEFSVHRFATLNEVDAAIEDGLAGDMSGASRYDLGSLPRFRLRLPKLSFGRKTNEVQNFVAAHYRFAANLELPAFEPVTSAWLSVVVPVYNAPKRYLDDLVQSFLRQDVPGVELILSDDASTSQETLGWYQSARLKPQITIVRNKVNGGIAKATNAGLEVASGEWVTLLDHDDVIAPHAFKMIRQCLLDQPECMFLYTDELVVDDHLKSKGLMLKPAYDPVLLSGVNYINHFSVYKHDRLREIGYLRTGFDGSQDYDLLLRYLKDVSEDQVIHLPYPAYWWRRNGQTYSRRFIESSTAAARNALAERFTAKGHKAKVEPALTETLHRVQFASPSLDGTWPRISIVIPSLNSFDLISRILSDLFDRTDYPDIEVIVIDNGSTDARVLDLYDQEASRRANFAAYIKTEPFNFARAVNRGIALSSGQHFLVLNNDVEVIDGSWLKEMVCCLNFEGVGIVGAKLLYPNNKIQHAGVIAGFGGLAGHWFLNKPADYGGPMNRLHLRNSMTCVTGAVMLISGDCSREIGAWDEENFAIAYNDVDYCLRAYKSGYRAVWTPFACLYHHESVSRGSDMVGERKKRFEREKDNLRLIHGTTLFEDPAINPGYEKRHSTPGLEVPHSIAKPRRWHLASS